MSTLTKVFVVLTAVLSIAASCLFIATAAHWQNWRATARTLEAEKNAAVTAQMQAMAAAQISLAMKDDEVAEKNREIDELQRKGGERTVEIAALKSNLARVQSEKTASESSRTKIEEILAVTTGELKALQKKYQEMLAQSIETQTRNAQLNSRVLELTANVTILTDEARNLQEKLYASTQRNAELERLRAAAPRVEPEAEAAAKPGATPKIAGPIKGQVVEVDGRRASVNIGETSGVVQGMKFMVYRGTTFLADLVIDNVRPKECGGRLELVAGDVRPGDLAQYADE